MLTKPTKTAPITAIARKTNIINHIIYAINPII